MSVFQQNKVNGGTELRDVCVEVYSEPGVPSFAAAAAGPAASPSRALSLKPSVCPCVLRQTL